MLKWLLRITLTLVILVLALFWLAFSAPRPPLTIDPATLAGDGSTINYCDLPVLDGSGKLAADIPKGNTPGCGYSHFPMPILAQCTEPLPEGTDDIRGLWLGVQGGHVGRLALGEVEELWDAVGLAVWPSRKAMLEVMQSEGMQAVSTHRAAGLAGQLNIETSALTGQWLEGKS